MTTDVVHDLAEKWLPFPPEMFDEKDLPPSVVADLRSPLVTQSKLMVKYSMLQQLNIGAQREAARQELARRQHATAHVGKRVKASRH